MKQSFKRIVLIATLVAIPVLVLCLIFVQPLLPSSAYAVKATLGGRPIKAELLHPPFMPGLYYVHLPDAKPQRWDWFGIAFSRQSVFWPGAHYTGWGGIRYIRTDQAHGVRLTSGKMEDHWDVEFPPSGVQFSNANETLAVTLYRAP